MNPIVWNTLRLIARLQGWQPEELVTMVLNNNELSTLQKMYIRRYLYRRRNRTNEEKEAAYRLCMDMWPYVTCMRPLSEEYNGFQ